MQGSLSDACPAVPRRPSVPKKSTTQFQYIRISEEKQEDKRSDKKQHTRRNNPDVLQKAETQSSSAAGAADRGAPDEMRQRLARFLLCNEPCGHIPQGLLQRARLICKAFRCSRMAEAAV